MAEKEAEKYVVVTRANEGDRDYVRAVVHTDEDSANEYLAEVKAAAPWQNHTAVPADQFASDSEKATQSEEEASKDNTDDTGKGEH